MKTNSNSRKSSFKLVLCEAAIVAYATYFSGLVLVWLDLDLITDVVSTVITCFSFMLTVITINLSVGLYESGLREPFRGIIRRIFVSAIISFFVVTIATNALYRPYETHPLLAPLAVTFIIMSLVAFRYIIHNTESMGNKPNIVILGAGVRASVIEKRMRRMVDRANFNLVSFIPVSGDQRDEGIEKEKIAEIELDKDFDDYIKEQEVTEIIVANDQRRGTLPIDILFNARLRGVQVTDLLDFMERETGQIAVDLMYPSWVIYSNGFQSQKIFRTVMDYWLNIFLAFLVLFFTWPIMLITALIIYIDDGYRTGASVFYKQQRVGKDGKLFNILKFRSMRPDAEKDGAKWASKNDSRVTTIGAFIRKYRVDELPQLLNVLRGDMSFIGPRPERPEFVEQLVEELPYFNQRHNVKPGLAGWAQLNYPYGASVKDSLEKLKFDLYYVKHQSLLLDLLILVRTVEVILFGKGR